MEAYNRYNKCVYEWNRYLFRFVGHDVIVGTFKRNAMSYFVYILAVVLIVTEVYTLFNYDDLFVRVFCVHISLYTVQALTKLFSMHYVEDIQWLLSFIQNFYKVHITTKSVERAAYFRKFALAIEYIFLFIMFFYTSTVASAFMFPVLVYFTKHELIPLIPLFIPGIDEKTTIGYIALWIYHTILELVALFGVMALDFVLVVVILSTLMFSKLISWEMDEIHRQLQEKNSALAVKVRFRNILLMHHSIFEYMERVDTLTFKTYFAQVTASAFGAIILIYVVLVLKFLPAAAFLFGYYIFIFYACLLGNVIEMTNDRIYDAALDFKWNELPIDEQRMYLLFIERCQHPPLLSVGGFYPLNLDTCLAIFSKIYNTSTLIYTMLA